MLLVQVFWQMASHLCLHVVADMTAMKDPDLGAPETVACENTQDRVF